MITWRKIVDRENDGMFALEVDAALKLTHLEYAALLREIEWENILVLRARWSK